MRLGSRSKSQTSEAAHSLARLSAQDTLPGLRILNRSILGWNTLNRCRGECYSASTKHHLAKSLGLSMGSTLIWLLALVTPGTFRATCTALVTSACDRAGPLRVTMPSLAVA